jgi:hypothetical protein
MDTNTIGPLGAPEATTQVHEDYAQHGWSGSFAEFTLTEPTQVLVALQRFIPSSR